VPHQDYEKFTEPWTEGKFPDPSTGKRRAELRINDSVVKSVIFIDMDGGRYFVPMPEIAMVGDERVFYWVTNSTRFKVGKIIGTYYGDPTIEGVARHTGVRIVDSRDEFEDARIGR
jgi:hypothetical protein